MSALLRIAIFFITFILIVRLAQLQVIQGRSFSQRSTQNRFRIDVIPAQRGSFYDRTGKLIVDNGTDGTRRYLAGPDFAHVIGYLGQADTDDMSFFGVEMGREVGKMGLEKEDNQILAGQDGGVVEEVTADGTKLRQFSKKDPVNGRNVQLSIHAKLQAKARQLLAQHGYHGAIVAGTLQGDLLALVSYPDFDPNTFSTHNQKEISGVLSDQNMPLFNRAIGGLYPPASTFKLVTAVAALESKALTSETVIEDTGAIQVGQFRYTNWYYTGYGRTDGQVDMAKALQRSNDIFFYKAGELTGIAAIAKWARTMGLGSQTGIALEGEAEGLVPDENWKKVKYGEPWYLGDTYITAIGQGNLLVTPVQVLRLTTSIANGGKWCPMEVMALPITKPFSEEQIQERSKSNRCYDLGISLSTLKTVRTGMKQACDSGGTGWPLFNFQFSNPNLPTDEKNFYKVASSSGNVVRTPVACKTGTAEIGGLDEHGKPSDKTHAWFTAFAPADKPEIVVTVLLEEAGQGSDKAGPVVRELLKTYFEEVR